MFVNTIRRSPTNGDNYVLSGVSGFSYDFDIFTGQHRTDVPDNCPDNYHENKMRIQTGNIVTRLLDTVARNVNHKWFIDNFYTSLPLMAILHGIGILPLGTIQLYLDSYQELRALV